MKVLTINIQLIICLLIISASNIFPTSLSVDIFNGLQKRVAFNIETSLDVQESMIFGNALLNESRGGVNYEANFFDVSYRRYVLETTDSGIFYSLGLRGGSINLSESGVTEKSTSVIPFYDIGLKSKLSENWFSYLKIEASYVIIYTNDIDVDHLIGLQFFPFFSFGYKF